MIKATVSFPDRLHNVILSCSFLFFCQFLLLQFDVTYFFNFLDQIFFRDWGEIVDPRMVF